MTVVLAPPTESEGPPRSETCIPVERPPSDGHDWFLVKRGNFVGWMRDDHEGFHPLEPADGTRAATGSGDVIRSSHYLPTSAANVQRFGRGPAAPSET